MFTFFILYILFMAMKVARDSSLRETAEKAEENGDKGRWQSREMAVQGAVAKVGGNDRCVWRQTAAEGDDGVRRRWKRRQQQLRWVAATKWSSKQVEAA